MSLDIQLWFVSLLTLATFLHLEQRTGLHPCALVGMSEHAGWALGVSTKRKGHSSLNNGAATIAPLPYVMSLDSQQKPSPDVLLYQLMKKPCSLKIIQAYKTYNDHLHSGMTILQLKASISHLFLQMSRGQIFQIWGTFWSLLLLLHFLFFYLKNKGSLKSGDIILIQCQSKSRSGTVLAGRL